MCFMLQLIYASVIPAKMEQLATVMVKHTNAHVHLDLLDFTVKQVKCKAVISSQYGVALWNIAFIVKMQRTCGSRVRRSLPSYC